MCREKVASVAGDAPFLISKPFLQRTCPVQCHNRSKLCLYLLSLRSVIRVWWCVVFTSMLVWVSRLDEYLYKT